DHGESGYGRLEPYIQFPPQAQTYGLAHKGPEAKPQVFLYHIRKYKFSVPENRFLIGDKT
ncbi:hypothetical protein, partial [Paenibacillus alginolyticus]